MIRGKHIIGRAMMVLTSYDAPLISPSVSQPDIDPRIWDFLGLGVGPVIEDAILTRTTTHLHGVHSQVEADGALVYFDPARTLHQLWQQRRRIAYEARRLDILFPEYRPIPGRYFGKRVDRQAFARLPFKHRLAGHIYLRIYPRLMQLGKLDFAIRTFLVRRGARLSPFRQLLSSRSRAS